MKQQCKCGNWVEGKPIASVGRKITRGLVKKGMSYGPAAIGAEIGTMIAPGLGSVLGGLAGLAYGAVCEDGIKEVSDAVEDKIFNNDKIEYEFCCPNCGRKWSRQSWKRK